MKLHLGSDFIRLDGWVSIDLDSPVADRMIDLRKPLPYTSDVAHFIYAEHFIEHITRSEAFFLMRECRRFPNPGGVLRLSTPNIQDIIDAYIHNDFQRWGALWQPRNRCHFLNEAFYNWGHKFLYDADEIKLALEEAGFQRVDFCEWGKSSFRQLKPLEHRKYNSELIVEVSVDAS